MKSDLLYRPRIIQPEDLREGEQKYDNNWLAESIGNAQLGLKQARPFTANFKQSNSQHSKRLSFYRKFMNRSVNDQRKTMQQPKQQHRESMFLPYECKTINQEETAQPNKNHLDFRSGNDSSTKNKSFEGFLQSKRRKDSLRKREEGMRTCQKQKVVTCIRSSQTQREEKSLNLLGRPFTQQQQQNEGYSFFTNGKIRSNPEERTRISRQCPFATFSPSQRDSSTVTPLASFKSKQSKLSTIHSQAERAKVNYHYIRYTFQEDQGYALFNKSPYIPPQPQKKKTNPSNRRKLLLFNQKPAKQPQSSALQPSVLLIQGWEAPAQEEDLLPK